MLITEEEAKTKRCQEGFPASPGATLNPATDHVQHTFAIPAICSSIGAGGSVTTTAAAMTAPIMCLGSACMAWRWAGSSLGYCGKAGAP